MKNKRSFSKTVKAAMTKNGLSAADIQKATGIPWATLMDYIDKEDVEHKISPNFKKLVCCLGLARDQILGGV
jgi:predicted transcriptional regulator